MIGQLLAKVIGTQNERELKRLRPGVVAINALEAGIQPLSDEQLRGKTVEFRQRVANGEPLDDLLPEAFAVVREAGRRVLNMRHFDVQLIGGISLHRGTIAEMRGQARRSSRRCPPTSTRSPATACTSSP
jgi:preprotein translocase subunit SecA